jgi:predicted DNA-binding transcriptional regulator YafY
MINMTQDEIAKYKVKILYSNHRNEISIRNIVPIESVFKATEYHPEEQWLLRAYDLDRQDERHFAFNNIRAWFTD